MPITCVDGRGHDTNQGLVVTWSWPPYLGEFESLRTSVLGVDDCVHAGRLLVRTATVRVEAATASLPLGHLRLGVVVGVTSPLSLLEQRKDDLPDDGRHEGHTAGRHSDVSRKRRHVAGES